MTANAGGIYWQSVDTSSNSKDAEFLASLMLEDIYNLKIVMLITDTCSTMKKTSKIVQDEFIRILFLPRQPHVASLLPKGVREIKGVAQLVKYEGVVVSWCVHAVGCKPLHIFLTQCVLRLLSQVVKSPQATRSLSKEVKGLVWKCQAIYQDLRKTIRYYLARWRAPCRGEAVFFASDSGRRPVRETE